MTTTDEITKDQQIQNQIETIQSLERKVESLEAELQKCLDLEGDSDTTRKRTKDRDAESLTYEEKQENKRIHETLMAKARGILRGNFMENESSIVHLENCMGNWSNFQNFLISEEVIDHLRTDKDFKWGVQLVLYTTENLDRIIGATRRRVPSRGELYEQLVEVFVGEVGDGCTSDQDAVSKLIEAFRCLKPVAAPHGIHEDDLLHLEIDLDVIQRCQAIAATAFKEFKYR